ncbi:MAG TPA: hypothetical protein VF795_07790 [Desulfuromonadaceae bacterium]
MHDISLIQDDIRYYRSVAVPAPADSLQIKESEAFPVEEIIRFAKGAGLCVTRALALVFKGEWQRSLTDARCPGADEPRLTAYLAAHPDEAEEFATKVMPGRGRTPSVEELHAMFIDGGILAASPLADQEAFREVVESCLGRSLFLLPAGSPELIEFACSREGAKAAFAGELGADAERYRILHAAWKELEEEVASLLLKLETQTLRNEKINQEWLETFGHIYVPLMELERLHSDLTELIEHVRDNPALSGRELEEVERELQNIHSEARRNRKREPAGRKAGPGGGGPGGIPWTEAEQEAYEEECKALLRRIWQLTHPDRIGREGFTEAQERRLIDCYQEAMAWKEKAKLDDMEIGIVRRSNSVLRIILDRVERIWEEIGVDTEGPVRVRGKTAEERLDWLEGRIAMLDEEIREIKADILAAAGDRDIREKEACMMPPERIAQVLGHMEERFAWYQEQIALHEEELAALLTGGPRGGVHG